MKTITLFFGIFLSIKAESDWTNVKERETWLDETFFPLMTAHKVNEADNRIVGGQEATPHQFPYQAGLLLTLEDGRRAFCGGSLISQNFVLTAAHCVDGMQRIEVILGAHKIQEFEDSQVRMNTTEFIVHEEWNSQLVRNDIALVKLPETVHFNAKIYAIDLPENIEQRNFYGYSAIVSGWGKIADNISGTSPTLQYVNTTIITNEQCNLSYPFLIKTSHICMQGNDGKSSCNGDSGGPLIITTDEKPKIVGIVSFGRSVGCEKGYPAVFTRVTSYLKWIENHINI